MRKGLLAFAAIVLCCAPAFGAFGVTVSGDAIQLLPPAEAGPGDLISNNYQVWYEGSGKIVEDLVVDHLGQEGKFEANDADLDGFGGTIAAGTAVDSYVAHLDLPKECKTLCCKLGQKGFEDLFTASLVFDKPIIGLSLLTASLDAGDIYGPDTLYPTGNTRRGTGIKGVGDFFSVSADGKTLELDFSAVGKDFDQVRVFTAAGGFGVPVPEPTSLAVWSISGLSLISLRRRRGRQGG